MEIRNNPLLAQSLNDDRDHSEALHESLARCGMAYAHLLAVFAGATEDWMRRRLPPEAEAARSGGPEWQDAMMLLLRARWIAEFNILLADLTAKQNLILPSLMERTMDPEVLRLGEQAAFSLWMSGIRWGVPLCRLLRLLNLRLQSGSPGGRFVRQYCRLSILALQQLHELLIHARRWRVQVRLLHPAMPELSSPALLERELAQLERAWLAARFCDAKERSASLHQIGLLQHWISGIREPYISRRAFVRRQTAFARPWLNEMIRLRIR